MTAELAREARELKERIFSMQLIGIENIGSGLTPHDVEALLHQIDEFLTRCAAALDGAPAPAAPDGLVERIVECAEVVNAATFSHVDGRDLLAELHPRHMIDIKVRRDGQDKWFQGDWLSTLYMSVKQLREALAAITAKEKSNA